MPLRRPSSPGSVGLSNASSEVRRHGTSRGARGRFARVARRHRLLLRRWLTGRARIYSAPEIVAVEPASIIEPPYTGPTAGGLYSYVAVWEWADAAGQIHRSAPSAPFLYSNADEGASEITVASLSMTRKRGVVLALYRNTAGGSLYFRVTPQRTPVNNAASPFLIFTDDQADESIEANELLYSAAEVDNDAPPASDVIFASRDRLFVAGGPRPGCRDLDETREDWPRANSRCFSSAALRRRRGPLRRLPRWSSGSSFLRNTRSSTGLAVARRTREPMTTLARPSC